MDCVVCSLKKSACDFPGSVMNAPAAPQTVTEFHLPHGQLLFACLECLVSKTELMKDAVKVGTISVETHEALFDEVADWKQWKSQQYSSSSSTFGDVIVQESFIDVSLLARQFRIGINNNTTVKEVKLQLGKLIDRPAPSIRLLFAGKDVKVKNNQTLMLLSAYNIRAGARLEALLPISKYAGQSVINGLGVDKGGNAVGAEADLGQMGGFVGMKIIFLDIFGECSKNVKVPLGTMGFEVDYCLKIIPPPAELRRLLATAHQLWVISDHSMVFNSEALEIISDFNKRGGALYLWGDNEPFYAATNSVLEKLLPGVALRGNYDACKYVRTMVNGSGPGFVEHAIFTGISNLYEGNTIARFFGSNTRLKYIMNSSEGQPCLGICEAGDNECSGRIAVDVAFTKLYLNWDSAGTARFVSNIAAWLCSPDSDWM